MPLALLLTFEIITSTLEDFSEGLILTKNSVEHRSCIELLPPTHPYLVVIIGSWPTCY